MPSLLAADVRVRVDEAGHDRLALARRCGGRRRECVTRPAGPTAAMRLPSTTIVPFSITAAAPAACAIVMMRAPVSAIVPVGTSAGAVKPMGVPFDSGSSAFSMPPPRNVNVRDRSRVKSSGPSDQCTLPAVARPVQEEPGVARDLRRPACPRPGGPMSIGRPVRANGVDEQVPALVKRHPLAVWRRHDVASRWSDWKCTISSLPSRFTLASTNCRALLAEVQARAGVIELRLDAASRGPDAARICRRLATT